MKISRSKYHIGVAVFLVTSVASIFVADPSGSKQILPVVLCVMGFFAFMVLDRIDQAAALERLEQKLIDLEEPVNSIRADSILKRAIESSEPPPLLRLSASKSFEYICAKVRSCRRMYNTSFSTNTQFLNSDYYSQWIDAIGDGLTQNGCAIREVMLSDARLAVKLQ